MNKFGGSGIDENFGSIDVGEKLFNEASSLQYLLNVETALARVQGYLGMIPKDCADEIVKKGKIEYLDEEYYREQAKKTGHPLMGLIYAFKKACDENAGEYVHWGTTTQDILDTAMVLRLKDVYAVVIKKVFAVRKQLAELADTHRDTLMIGRTNDQQALPITLGLKFASWLDELNRSVERLEQGKERIFTGQFFGAVGTLASFGEQGLVLQKALMEELDLNCPQIAWFTARDRIVEFVFDLAAMTACLGRIGNEVYNEMRSEVGELSEGVLEGNVGSSTMPHKHNPFISGKLAGYGRMTRTLMAAAMECMDGTNERDCRTLCVEPYFLKDICCLTDGSLDLTIHLLKHLQIHPNRIKRNLNLLQGLIFSEAVMMKLAGHMGRLHAHELMHQLADRAIEEDVPLKRLIQSDSKLMEAFTEEDLEELFKPENYAGLSIDFVNTVTRNWNRPGDVWLH